MSRFEGVGVYYGATFVEAQVCSGEDVIVVGGGNAAGQAAVFLAESTKHVYIVVRGSGLTDTMSKYLIRRIGQAPNVTVLVDTEVDSLEGVRRTTEIIDQRILPIGATLRRESSVGPCGAKPLARSLRRRESPATR